MFRRAPKRSPATVGVVSVGTESRRAAPSRVAVLLVMCVGYFLVLLDVTIVNVALPTIGRRLHAGVSGLQWVVDGYALALAGLMLTGGTLGDLHGHKRVVLCGLTVFGIASLGCGLAGSMGMLIVGRVGQGLGAALMLPGTLAVIANAYPDERERARAIGVWAGVGSCALPAGPLLGGMLVQGAGWRWVFLINVPIVAVRGDRHGVGRDREPPRPGARARPSGRRPGGGGARRVDLRRRLGRAWRLGVARGHLGRVRGGAPPPGSWSPRAARVTRCSRSACCAVGPS